MSTEPASAGATRTVFDADFLRKLERIELLARKIFRGHLRGEHTSRRRGAGIEFHASLALALRPKTANTPQQIPTTRVVITQATTRMVMSM